MSTGTGYVGRFAPSPTGPLHFGSLVAATASYLEARTRHGKWLLRIENIDPPREQAGASEAIVDALVAHGFEWDEDVIFQAGNHNAHLAALERLRTLDLSYPCSCSRKDLRGLPTNSLGITYPGFCRTGCKSGPTATRVRTDSSLVEFDDRLQGRQTHRLESESGDFVVHRRDGLVAYQLAVVVDDHLQGVTDVVRGIDLIDSTPRQIWLQRCLGYLTPTYAHVPVIVHPDGDKLSKLTAAPAIQDSRVCENLFQALVALKQRPPELLKTAPVKAIWQWAFDRWDTTRLLGNKAVIYAP